jgi:hypothetical protein
MLSKGMSKGMQAAGELWLGRIKSRLMGHIPLPFNPYLCEWYANGFDFLCDFTDPNPTEPSKYDAINRACAEWAKERDV